MDISAIKEKWQVLEHVKSAALREVLVNQHKAVQLVALAAYHLVPEKSGNSHLNLFFSEEHALIYSGLIYGDKEYRVGLNLKDLTLEILTNNLEMVVMADLTNHTTSEGFNFLEKSLKDRDVDVSKLKMDLPYNIHSGPAGKEYSFTLTYLDAVKETIKYRINANVMLDFFGQIYRDAGEIMISPKHYDTSRKIVLEREGDEEITTLTLGFSIQDDMADVPYFFVRHWSAHPVSYPEKMPPILYGQWCRDKAVGAFYKVNNISELKPDEQPQMVAEFYSKVIGIFMDITGKNN